MLRIVRPAFLLTLGALMAADCPGDSTEPPAPVFTIALSTAAVSMAQGSQTTVTVTVNRNDFTDAVALTVDGLSSGVTASFAPASVPDGTASSTLTLTASASATAGTSTFTIRANAPGVSEQSAAVALTVTANSSGLTTINMPLCVQPGDAITWFGYQNEGGAWTRVIPTNGIATFQATSKVAVRLVHSSTPQGGTGFHSNDLAYLTAAELQQFPACNTGTKSLSGTVAGLSAGQTGRVQMATSGATVLSNGGFSLTDLPAGALDLVAIRRVNGSTPNAIIIRRGQNLTGTIPALDFGAAESVTLGSNTLTVTGLTAGETNNVELLFTTNGKTLGDMTFAQFSGSSTPFATVPASASTSGDVHQLGVFAEGNDIVRWASTFFRTPGDKALALGPALSTPTISTVATSPIVRMRVQLPSQAEYNSFVNWGVNQSNVDLWVTISASYLGATPTTWDVTHPDMSGASGWDNAWGLKTGQSADVYVLAANGSIYLVTGAPGADGETAKYSERTSQTATMSRSQIGGRFGLRRGFTAFGKSRQ